MRKVEIRDESIRKYILLVIKDMAILMGLKDGERKRR